MTPFAGILAAAALLAGQSPSISEVAVPPDCMSAVRASLGPGAVVLRYGHLSTTTASEALAVVKLASAPTHRECVPVSRAAVFRLEKSGWKIALDAAKEIRNTEGYIGLSYIDDAHVLYGYCLSTTDKRSDGVPAFSLYLSSLERDGTEGLPTEISWNQSVGRYQEVTANAGSRFKPELKNPPHIHSRTK